MYVSEGAYLVLSALKGNHSCVQESHVRQAMHLIAVRAALSMLSALKGNHSCVQGQHLRQAVHVIVVRAWMVHASSPQEMRSCVQMPSERQAMHLIVASAACSMLSELEAYMIMCTCCLRAMLCIRLDAYSTLSAHET